MSDRDGLKPLSELLKPDVRNTLWTRTDLESGESRHATVEDHYSDIERYDLHNEVPDDIATQYDVARNIYAYAWFEYRFFNIAEAQVLTVLELAMKKRIGEEKLKTYIRKRQKEHQNKTGKKLRLNKGMKVLMEYCGAHNLVCNEGFSQWRRHATNKAYHQAQQEQLQWARAKMKHTGDKSIELPEIIIEELTPDPDYNHVQHLIDHTNKVRNGYAHGSIMLHNQVIDSFEMVSEFINQLFLPLKKQSG